MVSTYKFIVNYKKEKDLGPYNDEGMMMYNECNEIDGGQGRGSSHVDGHGGGQRRGEGQEEDLAEVQENAVMQDGKDTARFGGAECQRSNPNDKGHGNGSANDNGNAHFLLNMLESEVDDYYALLL